MRSNIRKAGGSDYLDVWDELIKNQTNEPYDYTKSSMRNNPDSMRPKQTKMGSGKDDTLYEPDFNYKGSYERFGEPQQTKMGSSDEEFMRQVDELLK